MLPHLKAAIDGLRTLLASKQLHRPASNAAVCGNRKHVFEVMFYRRYFFAEHRLWLETEKSLVFGSARMPLRLEDDRVRRIWNESRLKLLSAFPTLQLISHQW